MAYRVFWPWQMRSAPDLQTGIFGSELERISALNLPSGVNVLGDTCIRRLRGSCYAETQQHKADRGLCG
jgi:hypothetical protein